jgi:hypothetical protein
MYSRPFQLEERFSPTVKVASRVLSFTLAFLPMIATNMDTAAEEVDWNRYAIEGRQISTNYSTSLPGRSPFPEITVTGRSQDEAIRLIDGSYQVYPTTVNWVEGERAEIMLDLLQRRFVSSVVMPMSGKANWEMAASTDGQTWWPIEPERWVNMGPTDRPQGAEIMAATNLAVVARYLRIRATPVDGGLTILEIFVFGEEEAETNRAGSVFTSFTPPVAGEQTDLRIVLRNFGHELVKNVKAELRQVKPTEVALGRVTVGDLPPQTARVAILPWIPGETEPHDIEVRASGEGWPDESVRVTTIPVVNRRLYFPYWSRVDYQHRIYANVSTTEEDFWYYPETFRGHLFLRFANATHMGDLGFDKYYSAWSRGLHGPLRHGISMVEWSSPYPTARDALEQLYQKRGDRFILAWLAGGPSEVYGKTFQNVDLVLQELYLNYSGHDRYRELLDRSIDGVRKHGPSDRWGIALGLQGEGHPSTFKQIEREVRYLRYRGPELPGVAFYGCSDNLLYKQCDSLCYKYFIAPAVRLDETFELQGNSVQAVLQNIGGMNARNVKLAAYDAAETALLGTATVPLLKAGEERVVSVKLDGSGRQPKLRVLPSLRYTDMNPPTPVEAYPSRQVRGLPLKICWTPPGRQGQVHEGDNLVFTDVVRGEERHRLNELEQRGTWKHGSFYLEGVDTSLLEPGDYQITWTDGTGGTVKGTTPVTILGTAGAFWISQVNGETWKGDPQQITIDVGDTFEMSWDTRDSMLLNGGIYISAPGDGLEMPRPDGSYAVARIPDLMSAQVIRTSGEDPVRLGSFTWKEDLELDDLYFWHRPKTGWLRFRNDIGGAELKRVDICQTPGTWRLWMGADQLPAFPVTPVVTVTVRPTQTEDQASDFAVNVEAPDAMTTGDLLPLRVHVKLLDSQDPKIGIEKVEFFKMEAETSAPDYKPRLQLDTVANPNPTADQFTARFMIFSPEPGEQHFGVRVVCGGVERFAQFKIAVRRKVLKTGEKGVVHLTSNLPAGWFDSFNFLYAINVSRCTGSPDFGPVGDSGVRWIRNLTAFGRTAAEEIGRSSNSDLTSPEFITETTIEPESEPGLYYYTVGVAYMRKSGHIKMISVQYE